MTNTTTERLAVLIDAENVPAKHVAEIFEEVATLCEASLRRIYGDFSRQQMSGWQEKLPALALVPHHQPANTVGKNASDIALVIEAMDFLHSGRFDGCIPHTNTAGSWAPSGGRMRAMWWPASAGAGLTTSFTGIWPEPTVG